MQQQGVRSTIWAVYLAAGLGLAGCADPSGGGGVGASDAGVDGGGDVAVDSGSGGPVARWNPPEGPMPLPSDWWRTDGEGLEVSPGGGSAAGDEYRAYLSRLDGYPTVVRPTFPVSAPVAEAELAEHVRAWDGTNGEPLDVNAAYDPDGSRIRVGFESALAAGHDVSVLIRGGSRGLQGTGGLPVVADRLFGLVRSGAEISESSLGGASSGLVESLKDVRQDYESTFGLAKRAGIERSDVAVATEFRTASDPFIRFDLSADRMPSPNDYRIDPETGTVDVPVREGDPEADKRSKRALSTYDGFSTTGALILETTQPIDASTIEGSNAIRLFEKPEGEAWTERAVDAVGVFEDDQTIWARPKGSLTPSSRFAYVVTDAVKGLSGAAVHAQPAGAALRFESKLVDEDGESLHPNFGRSRASRLEPLRRRSDGLLRKLATDDRSRQSVAGVFPFRTVDVLQPHLERRAELYERDIATELADTEEKSPLERGLLLAMPRVKTVVTGTMTTLDRLDPETRMFFDDGSARQRQIDFVLTVPRGYDEGEEIPVVLFGHGLMTSRELVYLIADKLADAGFAVMSVDLPYHGRRAVCLKDVNCQQDATCNAKGQCVEPDGSDGELKRVGAPDWLWQDGPDYPLTTGRPFVELDNMVAARDHFAQALVDLMQTVRVIRGADWETASGGWKLDGDDVVYMGMSLGGILGANLAAVEPTIDDFALNVPGADFATLIEQSDAFQGAYLGELDDRGLKQDTEGYYRFIRRMRWLLDRVDPRNLGLYAQRLPMRYEEPSTGAMKTAPEKRVLIQMAKGDSVMPNASTRMLAEQMGVEISTYEPAVSDHGFVFDPTSLEGAAARDEIVEFFEQR